MKAIYTAIRSLLYPGHALKQAGAKGVHPLKLYDAPLYYALEGFELRARGFRDLLDCTPSLWRGIKPEQVRKFDCSELLNVQTLSLVRVVCRNYQLPNAPGLDAVLDAPDTSGRLLLAVQNEIKNFTKVVLTGLAGDYTAMVRLEQREDGTIAYMLEAYCPHLNEMAERVIELPVNRVSTLRDAHRFLFENQVVIQDALEPMPTWPEFQPTAQHLLKERIAATLHEVAQAFTPEEREFMLANWTSLRPAS